MAAAAMGVISSFLFIFIWLAALFNAAGKTLIYLSAVFFSIFIFLAGLLVLGFSFVTGLSGHTSDSAEILSVIMFLLSCAFPVVSLFILKRYCTSAW